MLSPLTVRYTRQLYGQKSATVKRRRVGGGGRSEREGRGKRAVETRRHRRQTATWWIFCFWTTCRPGMEVRRLAGTRVGDLMQVPLWWIGC